VSALIDGIGARALFGYERKYLVWAMKIDA
jgi:hypothetical protein